MARTNAEVWSEWRELVNMTPAELRSFLDVYGSEAGLSRGEARREGVRSGRDSARALLRMMPSGRRSLAQAERNWSDADWQWARRQVAFIKRMKGTRGPLFDQSGRPTRKMLSLLLWGHAPA